MTSPDPRSAVLEVGLTEMASPVRRRGSTGFGGGRGWLTLIFLTLAVAESFSQALAADRPGTVGGDTNAALQAALQQLNFPGVTINLQERSVDVAGSICLRRGSLELVACTKGTKEHESIVAIEAKPMHLHTALLLLGAKPGSPATRQQVGDQAGRWRDVPPSGGRVDVFLVLQDNDGKPVEHPISDFIAPSSRRSEDSSDKPAKFPTHTFLFAGSVLLGEGPGPRRYLSDESGNVISLVTFGDEVLCLPAVHSQANEALLWQVDPTNLPAVGTKVTLRLRPQVPPAAKDTQASPSPSRPVPEKPLK
jgi:hypothetical protein